MSTGKQLISTKKVEIQFRKLRFPGATAQSESSTAPVSFIELTDGPTSYVDKAGSQVRVNSDETGVEFSNGGVEEKTDDYVILASDFGKMIMMNAAVPKTFTLPAVTATDIDRCITLVKRGAGGLTIQTSGTDKIDDGSAGGTLYNDLDEVYSLVILKVIAAGQWLLEYAKSENMAWRKT